MNRKTRISGAVLGGTVAAFISMGTASADDADSPNYDPFTDLLSGGPTPTAAELAAAHAADATIMSTSTGAYIGSSFDIDYDNWVENAAFITNDADPYEDLLPANATPLQDAQAIFADEYLYGNDPTLAANLDAGIDAGTTGTVLPTDTEPDSFTDMLGSSATATQLAQAAWADATLVSGDSSMATNVDEQVMDAIAIPPGDNDPFEDILPANATAAQQGMAVIFDWALYVNDPTLAATLDAQIDTALAPDTDPFTDLAQAFGANATGLASAATADAALSSSTALSLDNIADQVISAFHLGSF